MERFRQEKSLQRALDGLRQLSASLLSSSDPAVPSKASGLEHGGSPCRANLQIRSMVDYQELVRRFREQLRQGRTIDLKMVRCLVRDGCPDSGNLRVTAWKLLLGYLPPDIRQWEECLRSKRSDYERFCQELTEDPRSDVRHLAPDAEQATPELHSGAIGSSDHPLNMDAGSRWHGFFQDNEVLEQIDRDVCRTRAEMHFFSGTDAAASQNRKEMSRALFIYAKLNPGLQYVQGMNELLAPLYWLCRGDSAGGGAEHAEADSWHLFVALVSDFRDNFCKQLDNTQMGIKATLGRLSDMLKQHDRELWYHLAVINKVDPQFYAFRWVTLLLTQEFEFPELLRLWDALLADPAGRADMMLRLCLAMLLNVREQLLVGDFGANIKLLQCYPQVDVGLLLQLAKDTAQDSRHFDHTSECSSAPE